MFKVDFLVMLSTNAKNYKYHGLKALLQTMTGQIISVESASTILNSYLDIIKEVEEDQVIIDWVYKEFEEYKKILLDSLLEHSHLNGYDKTGVINENNATSILIDFVNYLSSAFLVDITFHI